MRLRLREDVRHIEPLRSPNFRRQELASLSVNLFVVFICIEHFLGLRHDIFHAMDLTELLPEVFLELPGHALERIRWPFPVPAVQLRQLDAALVALPLFLLFVYKPVGL